MPCYLSKIITNTLKILFGSMIVFVNLDVQHSWYAQETLLPAPTISAENPLEANLPEFTLSWDALDETNFYNFEICRDALCSIKVKEISKAGQPNVTLTDMQNGQYFWRVSGVDKNDQLGDYTTPQPLLVEIDPVLKDKDLSELENSDKQIIISEQKNLKEIFLQFPWYIYLIMLAYIVFGLHTFIWYINK